MYFDKQGTECADGIYKDRKHNAWWYYKGFKEYVAGYGFRFIRSVYSVLDILSTA